MTRFCRLLCLFVLLLLAVPDAPGTVSYAYADSSTETLEDNIEAAEVGSMGHLNGAAHYVAQLPAPVLSLGPRLAATAPARAPLHPAIAAAMQQYLPQPNAPPPRRAALL